MEIQQADRKTFTVNYVQVALDNYLEVAEWCRGTVEMKPTRMLGTETLLPCIKLRGQGKEKGRENEAPLGSFIVELKGSYRVYKPAQFHSAFEKKRPTVYRGTQDHELLKEELEKDAIDREILSETEAPDQDADRTLDIPNEEDLRSSI